MTLGIGHWCVVLFAYYLYGLALLDWGEFLFLLRRGAWAALGLLLVWLAAVWLAASSAGRTDAPLFASAEPLLVVGGAAAAVGLGGWTQITAKKLRWLMKAPSSGAF